MTTRYTTSALHPVNPPVVASMANAESPFERSIREFQDAITRRARELWEHSGYAPGHDLENWLRAESEVVHFSPVEIADNGDELHVNAEVPGFNARDIDIYLEPRRVIIRGRAANVDVVPRPEPQAPEPPDLNNGIRC